MRRIKKLSINFWLKSVFAFMIFLSLIIVIAFRNKSSLPFQFHHAAASISYPPKPDKNYFKDAKYYQNLPYVLKTSTCRIPDFSKDLEKDYWMKQLLRRKAPKNCTESLKRWTYVNGTAVILDELAVKDSGYSLSILKCCYSEIRRVDQSPANYNSFADQLTNLSENCIGLHNGVNSITVEFIRVQCLTSVNNNGKPEEITVYANYHAFVNANKTSSIKYKIRTWRKWKNKQLPPNVLILGIDSLSRSNFQRSMPKTAKVLHELGAVDMLGFLKVGVNTFPNIVPALSGINIDDLPHFCANYRQEGQDNCSYIWKDFNSSHYLTAHIEDAPEMNIFNYAKIGFVQQQVDFYIRPFMISSNQWKGLCIGPDRPHNKVLNYFRRLFQMASDQHVPLFSFTWLSSVAHHDMNNAASADDDFQTFLLDLNLENTVLFFMGDHGARFGSFRSTHHGWYEDKLPNFWLYLPPYLRNQKPEWIQNLHLNSKRLFSPFDIYHTLRHILKDLVKFEMVTDVHFQSVGQSLFEEIPASRTCKDANVDDAYCPCLPPHQIPVDSYEAKLAANTAIVHLNSQLTSRCAQLSLKEVIAAATTANPLNGNSTKQRDSTIYIVTFVLHPGGVLIEATVRYYSHSKSFQPSKHIVVIGQVGKGGIDCVDDSGLALVCKCL